ncbi:MAG TPA: TetR/AcrR family transcriptional regulator [Treponema sp.]|jgi:AcrR family transcriptional regulator|nr:TetR/AcrR family transcriptional regulator [Treponema sp.]HBD68055.1 TetR/AcrR family transcriptional regulator [Treponema sp.]
MAVLVEHDKRKREILEKALTLFMEEGYEDVTYQKIADRCGITRTTLYIYFKNKREIFIWSIKQLTQSIEQNLLATLDDTSLSAPECLKKMCMHIIDESEANPQLFKVLLDYLLQLQKSGVDCAKRVRRRTLRLEHLMSTVLIRGMQEGQFIQVRVTEINTIIYNLIQSAILNLAVLSQTKLDEIRSSICFVIDSISRS